MDKEKLKSLQISADTTLKEAMYKLNDTAEKILFVTDKNNRLIGTITDGDIRRGIVGGTQFNDAVEKVMHQTFVAVKSSTPNIETCAKELMIKKRLESIPVTDNQSRIIDLIRWTDVLNEQRHSETRHVYPNHIVVMAGGKGTRLDPFTKILPKPLIPIGGKAVIEILMERFYQYGFHNFIYTLNYKKEYLKLFLKENNFPYTIDWVEEDDFLGTAGSLSLLKDKIDDTFFVVNCDSLLEINFEQVIHWHKEQKASMTVIGCHNEVKIPFGVLQLSDGRLQSISEKPVHDVIINTGVYVMEPHVLSYLPDGGKMDMNELIDRVVKKEKISVFPIYSGWLDIGQWEEYRRSVEKLGDF